MRKVLLILLAAVLIIALGAVQVYDGGAKQAPELPTETEGENNMGKTDTPAVKNAVLSFESFDGGGPEFDVIIEDPEIAECSTERSYFNSDHDQMTGSGYAVKMTFTGKKPGKTNVTVEARSPIADNFDALYELTVDQDLNASIEQISIRDLYEYDVPEPVPTLVIDTDSFMYYAQPADTEAAREFIEKLSSEPLTVTLSDYGNFEKVGDLPWELTRSDERITTKPGDIILYQGNKISIYYDENTWDFTRLATIGGAAREELLEDLGSGSVEVTFYVEWSE